MKTKEKNKKVIEVYAVIGKLFTTFAGGIVGFVIGGPLLAIPGVIVGFIGGYLLERSVVKTSC